MRRRRYSHKCDWYRYEGDTFGCCHGILARDGVNSIHPPGIHSIFAHNSLHPEKLLLPLSPYVFWKHVLGDVTCAARIQIVLFRGRPYGWVSFVGEAIGIQIHHRHPSIKVYRTCGQRGRFYESSPSIMTTLTAVCRNRFSHLFFVPSPHQKIPISSLKNVRPCDVEKKAQAYGVNTTPFINFTSLCEWKFIWDFWDEKERESGFLVVPMTHLLPKSSSRQHDSVFSNLIYCVFQTQ